MKRSLILICLPLLSFARNADSLMLRRLYDYYLSKGKAYSNLEVLCTTIGHRLSGSAQAAQAVEWAKKAMYAAGADTVMLQPCMVPHWVRGKKEKCLMNSGKTSYALNVLALGSSMGTGPTGINAGVIEIGSFDELNRLGEKAIKGKIVFYNVAFDQTKILPMEAYRDAVKYRRGASQAAKYGAVATLVRSMTSAMDDVPHTGNMGYDTTISKTKIPSAALGFQSADRLHAALKKDPSTTIYLETHCETLPDMPSFNVVGQINGSQEPNEFIIAGGHLDSWDVGTGAHDDGAGVVQAIELLAAFKQTGIRPKHSIRAVAFMNEENGLAGGAAYARFAKERHEKHLAALETDAGGFAPRAFNVDTLHGLYALAAQWKDLFRPYLIERIEKEGGGADISALESLGVPCIGYEPDNQRYFDIHHTAADTFDKVNKRELDLGAAAIGALIYLIDTHR